MAGSEDLGVIVCGVSGSGKSSVGQELATRLGWEFVEADDFHSAANIAKMSSGIPLTDDDRKPWLVAINAKLLTLCSGGVRFVLACSALKKAYRTTLMAGMPRIKLIFLGFDQSTIETRVARRLHFMPPSLLASQFEALEEPTAEEGALVIREGDLSFDKLIGHILDQLDPKQTRQEHA